MTHEAFEPARYKLIAFNPVPFFLTIAPLAIVANLPVLLGIRLKSPNVDLAKHVTKLIRSEEMACEDDLDCATLGYANKGYEMEVEEGSSWRGGTTSARDSLARSAMEADQTVLGQIWSPEGAATRDSFA